MKKILKLLILLLIGYSSFAQSPAGKPALNTTGYYKYGFIQGDSGFIFTERDTFAVKYPTLIKGLNHRFYYNNGNFGYWHDLLAENTSSIDTIYSTVIHTDSIFSTITHTDSVYSIIVRSDSIFSIFINTDTVYSITSRIDTLVVIDKFTVPNKDTSDISLVPSRGDIRIQPSDSTYYGFNGTYWVDLSGSYVDTIYLLDTTLYWRYNTSPDLHSAILSGMGSGGGGSGECSAITSFHRSGDSLYLVTDDTTYSVYAPTSSADGNNYTSSITFNSLTGGLTVERNGLSDLTTNLDGRYLQNYNVNRVISGGVVTWLHDYVYNVSEAYYYINNTLYHSSSTDITLTAADVTNGRIDLFVLTDLNTATVITGTPANPAVSPDYDANSNLQIYFATVDANSTAPTVTNEIIYANNTEWTMTASAGTINVNSTNNPDGGAKTIEGTAVTNTQYFTAVAPTTPNMGLYNALLFRIRSKANFGGTHKLIFQFYNGVTPIGNTVPFGSGSYGFLSTNTTTYQSISIPFIDFGNISSATSLRATESNTSGTQGWYIDNIQLQNIAGNLSTYGTLTNLSATNNYGQTWSILNPTTTPNISLILDTTKYATRDWRQKLADSLGVILGIKESALTFNSPLSRTVNTIGLDTSTTAGGWHSRGYYDGRYASINYSRDTVNVCNLKSWLDNNLGSYYGDTTKTIDAAITLSTKKKFYLPDIGKPWVILTHFRTGDVDTLGKRGIFLKDSIEIFGDPTTRLIADTAWTATTGVSGNSRFYGLFNLFNVKHVKIHDFIITGQRATFSDYTSDPYLLHTGYYSGDSSRRWTTFGIFLNKATDVEIYNVQVDSFINSGIFVMNSSRVNAHNISGSYNAGSGFVNFINYDNNIRVSDSRFTHNNSDQLRIDSSYGHVELDNLEVGYGVYNSSSPHMMAGIFIGGGNKDVSMNKIWSHDNLAYGIDKGENGSYDSRVSTLTNSLVEYNGNAALVTKGYDYWNSVTIKNNNRTRSGFKDTTHSDYSNGGIVGNNAVGLHITNSRFIDTGQNTQLYMYVKLATATFGFYQSEFKDNIGYNIADSTHWHSGNAGKNTFDDRVYSTVLPITPVLDAAAGAVWTLQSDGSYKPQAIVSSITIASTDLSGGTTGNSFTLNVNTNAITYSKIQQMPANTFLGNSQGSTANTRALYFGYGFRWEGDSVKVDTTLIAGTGGGGGSSFTLNTLTPSVQTFAKGTTAQSNDWGIVSSGSVHTFHFPDASATNRGLLTTTDWSLFNGKQDVITIGTFNNTSTAKGLDITSSVITLHAADTTNPGAVTAANQMLGKGYKVITVNNIGTGNGTGQAPGLILANYTASTTTVTQPSPSLIFSSLGNHTNGGSAGTPDTIKYWFRPVLTEGFNGAGGTLTLSTSQNAGAPGTFINFDGILGAGMAVNGTITAGSATIGANATGTFYGATYQSSSTMNLYAGFSDINIRTGNANVAKIFSGGGLMLHNYNSSPSTLSALFAVWENAGALATVSGASSSGSATITTSGGGPSQFTNAFKLGDSIYIGSEGHIITAIASASSATTNVNWTATQVTTQISRGATQSYPIVVRGSGLIGFGLDIATLPTAILDMPAGTAYYPTVRVRPGISASTIISGGIENNNAFYMSNSALNRTGIGGVIADFTADVNNSSTTETDLLTYTTKASTLASTGEKITAEFNGTNNDATATSQIQLYFAGTNIFNSTAMTLSGTGYWDATVTVIRTGSTTARARVVFNATNATGFTSTTETDITGLTFTNTNIIKCTGTAGGAGGGSSDITAKLGTIFWYPAANN
jgi:hypothetical protein